MKRIIVILLFFPGIVFSQVLHPNSTERPSEFDSVFRILYSDTVTPETLMKILSCVAQEKKKELICNLQVYQSTEDEKSFWWTFGYLRNCFYTIEEYNEDPKSLLEIYDVKEIKKMQKRINKFVREYSEIEILKSSEIIWDAGREHVEITYKIPNKDNKKRKMKFVKDKESTRWCFVTAQKELWKLSCSHEEGFYGPNGCY